MTDPSPYQPVPLAIPAGHPLLDASGFSDATAGAPVNQPVVLDFAAGLRSDGITADEVEPLAESVLALAIPSGEQLAAALAVIKASGFSVAEATAAHDQAMVALRASRHHAGPRCHSCDGTPTHQWTRRATDQEAENWHAGREQHIRAHNDGRAAAEYVSDRSDAVTLAVHGCDDHDRSPGRAYDTNAAKHEARQLGADRRALLHDADCGGHGACACGEVG